MKNRFFNLVMAILPFTYIIEKRIFSDFGIVLAAIVCILFVFMSSNYRVKEMNEKKLQNLFIIWLILFLLLGLLSFLFDINNIYYLRFYGLFLIVQVLFIRMGASYYYYNNLSTFLKYCMVLLTTSIVIDDFLMLTGNLTLQPMYAAENYTYHNRPFGLFGQPSVNSTLLCFFYLFEKSLQTSKYNRVDILFFVVTIGVVVQGSGSGFISYVFVLLQKFGGLKNKTLRLNFRIFFITFVLIAGFIYIAITNAVGKISSEYITDLIAFSTNDLWGTYVRTVRSVPHILFGIPNTEVGIDLGPLFLIATVGWVFFFFVTFIFLSVFFFSKQIQIKLAIIMLFVGNLHYPVMFYFPMHFIWFFVFYHVFVYEKTRRRPLLDRMKTKFVEKSSPKVVSIVKL